VCEETNALLVVITKTFNRGTDGNCTTCNKAEGDHYPSNGNKYCYVSTTSPCPPPHVYAFARLHSIAKRETGEKSRTADGGQVIPPAHHTQKFSECIEHSIHARNRKEITHCSWRRWSRRQVGFFLHNTSQFGVAEHSKITCITFFLNSRAARGVVGPTNQVFFSSQVSLA
jgi:hypothetical protein